MIDFSVLLVVVLLLYVLECVVWVPAGSVAFRLPSSSKRPIRMLTRPNPMARSGIAFSLPFSIGSGVIVCSPLPISVCPQGVASGSQFMAGSKHHDFIFFKDMNKIEPSGKTLLINGDVFVATASEIQAAELGKILKRLKRQQLKDRPGEIERELAHSLDASYMDSRLKEYIEKTQRLAVDSLALSVIIFLAAPIVVWKWGLLAAWPFLFPVLLLNMLLIAWDFRRVARELFPKTGEGHWKAIMTIILSPPAALHPTKHLALDFGRDCHPLALAAARCSETDFRELASWVLRDTMFAPEMGESTDRQAEDCAKWFRQRFQNAVSSLLSYKGYRPEGLIAPPPRESERVQAYCPRCLCQFVIPEGICRDCGEISLRAFKKMKDLK